jgi:hypothetical protein
LIVDFNPTNTTALNAFRTRYGISNSIVIYGPFSGSLANDTDSVELYRPDTPQQPPAADAGFVPYVIVDRVNYADTAPWPTGPVDGGGHSLQRLAVNLYGNEPLNWISAAPTPGGGNFGVSNPDTDGDGIPDAAEDLMGLDRDNPLDAALDNDLDGMTNREEYLAGTNHQDANSNLRFSQIAVDAGVSLSFVGVSNKTYTVLYKNHLTDATWSKLTDVPAGPVSQVRTVTDTLGGFPQRYYRLVTPKQP